MRTTKVHYFPKWEKHYATYKGFPRAGTSCGRTVRKTHVTGLPYLVTCEDCRSILDRINAAGPIETVRLQPLSFEI